jgi:hypothetical protein
VSNVQIPGTHNSPTDLSLPKREELPQGKIPAVIQKASTAFAPPCPNGECDGVLAGAGNGLWCGTCGCYGGPPRISIPQRKPKP